MRSQQEKHFMMKIVIGRVFLLFSVVDGLCCAMMFLATIQVSSTSRFFFVSLIFRCFCFLFIGNFSTFMHIQTSRGQTDNIYCHSFAYTFSIINILYIIYYKFRFCLALCSSHEVIAIYSYEVRHSKKQKGKVKEIKMFELKKKASSKSHKTSLI